MLVGTAVAMMSCLALNKIATAELLTNCAQGIQTPRGFASLHQTEALSGFDGTEKELG